MAIQINISTALYNSTRKLQHWPDLSVGMQSPYGIVSKNNKSKTTKSKISRIGYVLDKLLDKKISVCLIKHSKSTYVEYIGSAGVIPMDVIVDKRLKRIDVSIDSSKLKTSNIHIHILAATFVSILFNKELQKCFHSEDIEELLVYYSELNSTQLNSTFTEAVFKICDWFYYTFAKAGWTVEYEIISPDPFHFTLNRLIQENKIVHVKETPIPSFISLQAQAEDWNVKQERPSLYTEPLADFYKRCIAGEFRIDYQWSETQGKMVVPLSFLDSFIPTETFRLMLLSVWYQIKAVKKKMDDGVDYAEIMKKNPINIKVMGKPGSGKTTVIEAILASLGYPKGLINCKDHMEEDEIEGQNKFINGSIVNVPTKVSQLHSVGGAVILEEFNLPDPGILQGCLGQALVYPFILKVDGYREFLRHPLTIYFATMNIGTNGSKPVNEALSSRFPEGHILEEVSKDEFVNILTGAGYEKTMSAKIYDVYSKIINHLKEYHEDLVLAITLRHCLAALEKLEIGFTLQQAVDATFVSQLYATDPEVAKELKTDVLSAII